MDQVTVAYIRNVLNPLETREVHRLPALRTVPEYIREVCANGLEGYEIVASVNGCEFLPGEMEKYVVAPGDSLAFCAMPQGGGGSGKAIFSIVAMIAIMVVAPYAGGALAGWVAGGGGVLTAADAMLYSVGTAVAFGVGSGAVMVAGGLLISALAPRPDTPTTEESKSPTYSWDNIGNSIREGGTLPELFGSCRVVPPLIGTYIDTSGDKHFMNLLFAVAGHRVDEIDPNSIRINGSPIADFAGISVDVRLGADTQAVIQNFQDSHSDQAIQLAMKSFVITGITNANPCVVTAPGHTYSVGETIYIDEVVGAMGSSINGNTYKVGWISGDTFHLHTEADADVDSSGWGAYGSGGYAAKWAVAQTSGDVDEIVYGISFPKGIWYANDDGSLSTLAPEVLLQYKKHTDSVWTSCRAITTEPITVAVPRWYCGYWQNVWGVTGVGFVSVLTGSAVFGDHTEGEINYDYPVVIGPGPEDGSGYETITNPYFWHWAVLDENVEEGTVIAEPEFGISEAKQSTLYFAFATGRLTRDTYDVRVRRANAFPATSRYCADATFEYLQDVLSDDLTFPGVAAFSLRALATDQLSGGMPRVDVRASRNNVWVWTGSAYEEKPASNPAWVCYHILHRARRLDDGVTFVVEGVPYDRIDYASFLAWADYCADATPPVVAKTVHYYMSQTQTLRKQLNTVSLLGRGVVVQIGSKFSVLVDKLDATVQKFSFGMGNIIKDSYVEEFIPYDDRANAVEITYYDDTRDGEPTTVELYAFDFDTSGREINKATVALYGCKDREMAIQYGTWLLNNNRLLTMVASWEAGVDAIACLPGDVVELSHDVNLFGYSGRVESATTNTAVVDRDLTYVTNCQITVRHQDDDSVETKNILTIVGRTVNISGSWTKTPAAFANYVFSTPTATSKKFRVLDISRGSDLTYRIKGIEYDPAVYSDSITVPPEIPPTDLRKVTNLIATEVWRSDAGIGLSHVSLAWGGNAMRWNVWYRINNVSGWTWLGETTKPSFLAENLPWGYTYTFAVSGDSSNISLGSTVQITLYGKGSMPGEGLPVEVPVFDEERCSFTDKVYLAWAAVAESGIAGYEVRRGTDWASGVRVFRGDATSFVWNSYDEFPTTTSFTFHLKTFDAAGLYCAGEDSLTLSVAIPAAPSSVSVEASYGKIVVTWAAISNPIVVGVEVWRSTSNDRAGATLQAVIGGNSYNDASGITVGETYFYWLRAKTKYGTYSVWSAGDTSGHNGGATPPINTADIADEAISKIKLATSLVPPEVVTSLPTLPDANYPIGMIVFLTTDGKLYRNYGDVWTKEVAVDDLDRMLGAHEVITSYGPNLIPNGNSELGANAVGLSPEGNGLTNDPANAYAGQWCRKWEPTAQYQQFWATLQDDLLAVQAKEGDRHKFTARMKCTSGEAEVVISIVYYRNNGAGMDWLNYYPEVFTLTSSYQEVSVTSDAAPAGTGFVNFYFWANGAGTYYIDDMVGAEFTYAVIEDGSVTAAKLALSIPVPKVVATLPSLPDTTYPVGQMVYLTTDGKIYRNVNDVWSVEVDGGDIAATSITAGKIAVGAIGADAIASNVITTDKLIVANWTNNIPNWNFATGTTANWRPWDNPSYVSVVTNDAGGVPAGAPSEYVCKLASAGAGQYTSIFTHSKVYNDVGAEFDGIQCQAGEKYRISFYAATDGSYTATSLVPIFYYRKTDGTLASIGVFSCTPTGTWTEYSGDLTIPADATTGWIHFQTMDFSAGAWYLTNVRCRRINNSELIVDGAITADKLAANSVIAGKIEAGAIGADEIASNVIATKHLVVANFENLIPNGNSEAGSTAVGLSPEGDCLVNEPSNAKAGNWCRKWVAVENDSIYMGNTVGSGIPVVAGEEYTFRADVKCTSGGSTIRIGINAWDGDGSYISAQYNEFEATSSYQGKSTYFTIPDGAVQVRFYLWAIDAGTYYIDNMVAKRKIDTDLIVDGAITADKVGANEIIAQTANLADLVVQTAKIEDNAVTVPVSATETSTLGIGEGDENATEIISATITTHGQPVHIFFLVEHSTFNAGYDLHHHLYRDSTELRYYVAYENLNYACAQFSIVDQPSAGTYTYKIKSNTHSGGGTGTNVYWRNIILLETRK